MADEFLLKKVAAGDMAAMQACIDTYGGLVWSLARRLSLTPADAEDGVQEAFIALWENAERFDETMGSEVTFVAMIARRRLIDRARKSQRQQKLLDRVKEEPRPVSEGAEEHVVATDEARQVMQAMEQLSENQQRVLRLAIHRGLTHEQIAEHTGFPLGTVKTHARRGLMRIRDLLSSTETSEAAG